MSQNESVSDSLRRAISECGKSLNRISSETGIDDGQLSRFIGRKRSLTLPAVDRLAHYFGLRLTKGRKQRE